MWGAIVLVGGKSNRMKENKAFMPLMGKPLLLHVIDKILELVYEIKVVISKNGDLKNYSAILPSTVGLLRDCMEGVGPLAGMLTGLQCMRAEYALILPCDSPFIKKKVLKYLISLAQEVDAVIPRWPNGYLEPLHAVYKVSSTIQATKNALGQEKLFIADMIKQLDNVIYVDIGKIKKLDPELTTFFNINCKEDFMTANELMYKI